MAQQPFTTTGVQQKIAELYRLSPTDLSTQSNLILSNFRQWMLDNFTLDSSQQTYLANIDPAFIGSLSRSLSNAVNNRLPVNFTKAEVPSGASKFIRSRDSITVIYNTNGISASGELDIDIGAE